MFDGKAFGQEIVAATKAHVDKALAPIIARLSDLETRLLAIPDADAVANVVTTKIGNDLLDLRRAVEAIPEAPILPDIPAMIAEAIASIPLVEPAKSVDPIEIKAMVEEAVGAIPAPQPGKDVDMDAVALQVTETVERILAGWERPENGTSVTVEDVRPLIDGEIAKAVAAIPVPKDGCGIKELLIDRAGNLVATMDDGRMKDLGPVVGHNGVDVDMGAVERAIAEKVAAIPIPKDGVDGVGFDDMSCEIRDDGVYLVWEKGEVIKEARLPVPIDRGVWKEGTYKQGEAVTWGGSLFIAQKDTTTKPETPGSDWRMAVKRGRDGKDKA